MLSNPPYGKSWKTDLERMGGKSDVKDPRFVLTYGGEPEYKMLTRSSDGQLMFLVNKLTKMKQNSRLGSRIAQVHNGSSLFTGDAGQGESNIRRWIFENDWLEAIIALPENIFYNTGIATYIWVLTNRKAAERQGKVQLVNAAGWSRSLRKNMGRKNCELSEEHIQQICAAVMQFAETEQSKIFPNQAFGCQKVTVERPLRLAVDLSGKNLRRFEQLCAEAKETRLPALLAAVAAKLGAGPHLDYNRFLEAVAAQAAKTAVKLTAKSKNFLRANLAVADESAEPVIKKIHKAGKAEADPLYGVHEVKRDGRTVLVEYEPDSNLRDSEQIPLLEEGGIAAFIAREVLPYTPDAWVDKSKTQIGYEISFTKHFYKPAPMRTLEEITADIFALEQETEGMLGDIVREDEQ